MAPAQEDGENATVGYRLLAKARLGPGIEVARELGEGCIERQRRRLGARRRRRRGEQQRCER
jgi:hypothetical protein